MSTTAKAAKDRQRHADIKAALAAGKKPEMACRLRNRCLKCGRPRGYMRKFALCRLCFRKLALLGEIPGVVKSSW